MEKLVNKYYLRKVAQGSVKPCAFCFKPTESVLITGDQKDFFYTCDTHLKDTHFALPIDEEYSEALRKKQRIDNQIKTLKARWDEKNRYAGWDKLMSYAKWSKDEKDDKNDKKDQESEDKSELKDLKEEVNDCDTILQRLPRVYELNGDIFKLRLEKRKPKPALESTKIKDTSMFPDAPKGNLS